MQDIVTKAKELGTMIRESQEMADFKKCELEFEQDEKAKELFEEYKQVQIEMVRATKENSDSAIIEEIKESLLSKHNEIVGYDPTRNYVEAKTSIDNFMRTVNDVLMYAITGEEPCSSGNCGSCSGCK